MENKKIEEMETMLADVRRAHRLVFEYQKRMQDLMQLVLDRYNFPERPAGKKHFSDPAHKIEEHSKYKKGANLDIVGRWAWDFIYSYEMEYFFGKKTNNSLKCRLSIFQITDNGFYLQDGIRNPLNTETFWNADESSSYLIFVAEVCNKDTQMVFFPDVHKHIKKLYVEGDDQIIEKKEGCTLVAKRYPISQFFNYDSSNECLDDFAKIVNDNTSGTEKLF